MLNRFILRAIAVVFGLGFHSSALLSQAATTPAKPDFTAQLIVGGADKADPALAWLGLHVRLGPGWHTYWRAAGDAGAPPEFDWSRSQNLAAATVEWPAPHRYSDAGIDTFGYGDEVLFPIKLRLQDPLTPAHVSLKLALYVCGTICTRNEFNFDAEIVPGVRSADQLSLIDGWRTKVPRPESPDMKISSSMSRRRRRLSRRTYLSTATARSPPATRLSPPARQKALPSSRCPSKVPTPRIPTNRCVLRW
jgi:suppressor for copper-sensitivity B